MKRCPAHALRRTASLVGLIGASTQQVPRWSRRCLVPSPQWVVEEVAIKQHKLCPSPQSRCHTASRSAETHLQSWLGSAQHHRLRPSISCPAACQQGSQLHLPASRAGSVTRRPPTGLRFGEGPRRSQRWHSDGWSQAGRRSRAVHSFPHIWQGPLAEQL